MNETMMTVRGNLVDAPILRHTKSGHLVANFRIASTQRRFDREQAAWVDGDTLFVSVSAWRGLGENAMASLGKGQPVVVYGRYYQRDYTKDEVVRTAYELDAIAIGHDLTRGTTSFTRSARTGAPQVDLDADGTPSDMSHEYVGVAVTDDDRMGATDAVPVDVHSVTGEVRQLAHS